MGCCNKKNYLLDKLNEMMRDFYFRVVRHDFVINKIQDFNKSSKNYHEFWTLTKHLGIHSDLPFQVRYWETAFVSHSNTSLDGLLFIFLLLCQGDNFNKLEYVKYYLSSNINLSKENDNKLIMHCQEFKKILSVYFSCLSSMPLSTYIKVKNINDESSQMLMQEHFNEDVIKGFTDYVIKDYVKKNFYINAGKFLDQNIGLLVNDREIRKMIYGYKLSQGSFTNEEGNDGMNVESNNEEKPLHGTKSEKDNFNSNNSKRELIGKLNSTFTKVKLK